MHSWAAILFIPLFLPYLLIRFALPAKNDRSSRTPGPCSHTLYSQRDANVAALHCNHVRLSPSLSSDLVPAARARPFFLFLRVLLNGKLDSLQASLYAHAGTTVSGRRLVLSRTKYTWLPQPTSDSGTSGTVRASGR
ncbi:hypothetical protein V8E53_001611 [Lactarius tabidus]